MSWSLLTPYRLVTCGDDGLAKLWDVRKAALKRYGNMIGRRGDYTLPDQKEVVEGNANDNVELESETLPPVPMPQPNPGNVSLEVDAVPELPPAVAEAEGPVMNNVNIPNADNNLGNPGDFVANDAVDEGEKRDMP